MRTIFPTSHHWGPGQAEVRDGRVIAVGPHPDDPDPSRINENIADGIYHRSRVLRPAIRKGFLENGPGSTVDQRGQEPYLEFEWDKALEIVATELSRVKDRYGNEAIYAGSYGWASAGRFHHAQSQLKRFLNSFGGFVRSEGNYSYHAALVLMPHIVGNFREHVRQATRWSAVAKHGELVVMFGGLPLRNVQVSGGGIAKHRLKEELSECVKSGVHFVNISPLRSDASEWMNAEWIAPRPGSDTALMMGIAHTLLVEDRIDREFLTKYTVGFDRVENYLLGDVDGVTKNAQWASAMSEAPVEEIRSLARQMSDKRTLICTAVSLQRAEYGEQALWMTVTLAAMLGQIGLPGGGYGIGYGADASIGAIDRPVRWPFLPQGKNPVENYIPVACITDMLLNPGADYEFNGVTKQYPDIHFLWWAGGNPFHHHQDLNQLHQAFQRPETIIVNEIAWTATARHADIVLPVASPLERSDFGAGTQDNAIIPMPRVIAPVGESRQEFDIYCELERLLNMDTSFSEGKNSDEWLSSMWQELQSDVSAQGLSLPNLETFLEGDVVEFDDPAPQQVFLSEYRVNPDQNPLSTPSGKIELYSEAIDSFKYSDCPGHAVWLPPTEWLGADLCNEFPLHLISGQPQTRLHSQLDGGSFSASKKVAGREPVLINPDDAKRRGLVDGDVIRIFNQRGSCLAGVRVTPNLRSGVIFLWTGAWFDPDFTTEDNRDNHGNPNVLTHDRRTSRLSQGPAAQSALVEVEKFMSDVPAVKAFDPPLVKQYWPNNKD